MRVHVLGSWLCALALAASCDEEEPIGPSCTPGQTSECPCANDELGVQTCLADGKSFGSCSECGGGDGGSGGEGGSSSEGGAGATGGAGGRPGSGGEGGAVMGCDAPDCEACASSECATDACAEEIAACEQNPECGALEACLAMCGPDMACAVACSGDHTDGVADSNAKTGCIYCGADTCEALCNPNGTSC